MDYELKDKDTPLNFSNWKVLKCPGHTTIDISLYNERENLIYVADNLVGNQKKVFRPYPLFVPHEYKKSLQRYIDLGVNTFLLSHYGKVSVSTERLEYLIETSPNKSRRHITSLIPIFAKFGKILLRRLKR